MRVPKPRGYWTDALDRSARRRLIGGDIWVIRYEGDLAKRRLHSTENRMRSLGAKMMIEEFLNIQIKCHCGWLGTNRELRHAGFEQFKCPACNDYFRAFPINIQDGYDANGSPVNEP